MNTLKKILKLQNTQRFHTSIYSRSLPKTETETRWGSVVKEAEKVVGYPTSFLSLRWILNDEIANVAVHLRKLIGTNHPLLKTARDLLLKNALPSWGLIVLLVSKVAGLNSNFPELECDRTADILHSQRILAEVTEMIKTSHLMHRGIINIAPQTENTSDLNFGNNLALLSGDYLLSLSFNEIAGLRNFHVQEIIASVLRDLAESEFIGLRDSAQNFPIPSKPLSVQNQINIPLDLGVAPFEIKNVMGNMRAEWTLRNVLGGASLLGKCCQCTMILGKHREEWQELGYRFGRNLALAWQVSLEIDLIKERQFSLVSAPVMMHLEGNSDFYGEIEKSLANIDGTDYDFVRKAVMTPDNLRKTLELQEEFSQDALEVLDKFEPSESKTALINIIKSL